MSFKRPRIDAPTSFDKPEVTDLRSSLPPNKVKSITAAAAAAGGGGRSTTVTPPSIFFISPPEKVDPPAQITGAPPELGNFLECCYYCYGKIPRGKEVLMYGMLRGFCCPECRTKQMFFDKVREIDRNAKISRAKRCYDSEQETK